MGRKKILIRGKTFGRLLVLDEGTPRERGRLFYECRCECGRTVSVQSSNLRVGATRSCGCLKRERLLKTPPAHIHGGAGTSEYHSWSHAKHSCYRRAHPAYHRVGATGIRMCDEWLNDFTAFVRDMGMRPSPFHRFARKNHREHFCKENCHWEIPVSRRKKNGGSVRS